MSATNPKLFDLTSDEAIDAAVDDVREATDFLKAMAHEGRLLILCRLIEGECSVTELEELLSARQSAVSQQLARLRLERLVKTRREGKAMYYSLADERVERLMNVVYQLFCSSAKK